jgi:hypothetical protein
VARKNGEFSRAQKFDKVDAVLARSIRAREYWADCEKYCAGRQMRPMMHTAVVAV